jgi:hypothetical protein
MWRRRTHDYEVHGTIRTIEVHEIPNKARGKPSRNEARLRIDVTAVFGSRGQPLDLAGFPNDDFRGAGDIGRDFAAGDLVKVTYAPSTGRTIKSISVLDS